MSNLSPLSRAIASPWPLRAGLAPTGSFPAAAGELDAGPHDTVAPRTSTSGADELPLIAAPAADDTGTEPSVWRRAALAGCTILSLLGPSLATPAQAATAPLVADTLQVSLKALRGSLQASASDLKAPGGADALQLSPSEVNAQGAPVGVPEVRGLKQAPGDIFTPSPIPLPSSDTVVVTTPSLPGTSVQAMRDRLAAIQVPELDPFVFTIASEAWSTGVKAPSTEGITVRVPDAYGKSVKLSINTEAGPHAPMLVIIPGAFGSRSGNTVVVLEKLAKERGMNFVTLDNPLCPSYQDRRPEHIPGNPQEEARVIYDICQQLRDRYPSFFEKVSVTGYSYGALLSLGVVDAQARYIAEHPGATPVINGSVAAVSPPERLDDSMAALDSLHARVLSEKSGSGLLAALHYRSYVRNHTYPDIAQGELASSPSLATERKIVDTYGFRNPFQQLVEDVDRTTGTNALPYNKWIDQGRPSSQDEHEVLFDNYQELKHLTYNDYLERYASRDPWYAQHGTTAKDVLAGYRYSTLLESARKSGVPVMTIVSADDFILQPSNVETFRKLQDHPAPNEATAVLPHGGHVGVYYAPEVRGAIADFLSSPPAAAPATATLPATPAASH